MSFANTPRKGNSIYASARRRMIVERTPVLSHLCNSLLQSSFLTRAEIIVNNTIYRQTYENRAVVLTQTGPRPH